MKLVVICYLVLNVINLTPTFRGSGFPATKRSRSKAVIANRGWKAAPTKVTPILKLMALIWCLEFFIFNDSTIS
jgi:hypothetical protein